MDESLLKNLESKKFVGEKIAEFRSRKYGSPQALADATGLTGIPQLELGKSFPAWETLLKIIHACGTFSDFAAVLEPDVVKDRGRFDLVPNAEHRKAHEQLQAVLDAGGKLADSAVDTIEAWDLKRRQDGAGAEASGAKRPR